MSQQAGAGRSVMVEGRIVWMSGKTLFTPKVKLDQNTRQPRIGKDGQPMMEYGFGLAVRKESLAQTGPGQPGEIWAAMYAEAMTLYPNGQIPPSFAMKFKDGDTVDDKGIPFAQREGYAGHLVFACTTSIAIKFFKWENGGNVMISEGIKCGDYVKVQLQIKAHPAFGQGKAGLYLNPNMVQFLGYGKEIINSPSGDQIFGNVAPAMPQGASAMPLSPGPMPMTAPQAFAPPQQPSYQQPAPVAAPQPHYGVVPPAHQPPPGGMPMGNPMPPVGAAPPVMPGYPQPMAHPGQPAPNGAYPFDPQQPGGFPPVPR